ncbi:unnamed protein product [Bathycoccus prasinos]
MENAREEAGLNANEAAKGIPDRHRPLNLPQWGVPGLGLRQSSPVWSDLLVLKWLLGLCVGFPIVCFWIKSNLKKNKEIQKNAYLAAFQLLYLMPTFHIVVKATQIWYFNGLAYKETTAFERVFDKIWKFFISMGEFDLAWPEFLGSQLLSTVLSYWTMSVPYMQYYAVYYFGACELTNLPLAAIDLGRYYPSTIGSGMKGVVDIGLKVLFASLFVYFRVYGWFFMSKQTRRIYPPGSSIRARGEVVYGVVVMLGMFSLLNVAWLWQIAKEAKTTLFGGKKKKGKSSSSNSKSSAGRGQPPARKGTRSSARKKTN